MPRQGKQASAPEHLLSQTVGRRIREIRVLKGLSQTELEKKSGLLRSHISRVEGGLRTPTVETLERLAQALGVPLYTLFYAGQIPASLPEDAPSFFEEIRKILEGLNERDREAVLELARKLASR